jgi:glycosyltransferase involved in cell wall biosynthesis
LTNDAKSCLKFIECGARGVPVLASATADYRRVITDQINGLIAYDVDDWALHLKACASKKYDLHEMGLRAQSEVMQKFNIENSKFSLRDFVNGI